MTTSEIVWTPVLEVFVAGAAAPQGSKRHVGRGVMIESSKAVKPWREDVRAACMDRWVCQGARSCYRCEQSHGAWPHLKPPIDGPVRLVIDFVRKRPTSAPKRWTPPATTMPDLSKLVRSTEDAITSAGVWVDDARVTTLVAHKRLAEIGETPGAHIRVEVPE